MSKIDEINARNIIVALGGACEVHQYKPTKDPEVFECSECLMKVLRVKS
jgi:hypothetical protein